MRSSMRLAFPALLVLLHAAPSSAGSLASATLSIEFSGLAPIVFVGTGVSGTSAGALSATVDAGSGFAGMVHFPSPTSAAPPISGWDLTVGANGAGSFSPGTPTVAGRAESIDGLYEPIAGDFDGDGRDDVFFYGGRTRADFVWYGGAARTFTSVSLTVNGAYRRPPVSEPDHSGEVITGTGAC